MDLVTGHKKTKPLTSVRLSTGSVTWSCTTGCTMGIKLQSSTSTELKFSIQGTQQTTGSLNYSGDLTLYLADAGSNTRSNNNKSVIGTYNLTSKVFTERDKVTPEAPKVGNSTYNNGDRLISWDPVLDEAVEYYNIYVNSVLHNQLKHLYPGVFNKVRRNLTMYNILEY